MTYRSEDTEVMAVNGVSFTLSAGEKLALVGESGCGKSTIALALMGLLPGDIAKVSSGTVMFDGQSLLDLTAAALRRIRGRDIAMIFQNATASLNPFLKVGRQIAETIEAHLALTPRQAWNRAAELLALVRIADPARRLAMYPHEMSGGMCQRVMIAMALSCNPRLLLADEPTTALDTTVQAQILDLITRICAETGAAMLLITHDLGVVAGIADRVAIVYAGSFMETAGTYALFAEPTHPYTQGLLAAIPRPDDPLDRDLRVISGMVGAYNPHGGCSFALRCGFAGAECRRRAPPLVPFVEGHLRACWVDPTELAVGADAATRLRPLPVRP